MYQVGAFDQPAMKQANGHSSRRFGHRPIARKVALFLTMLSTLTAAAFGLEKPGHAHGAASNPTGCKPQDVVARAVTRLTGPSSMRLDDGSEIKLAGVLLPTALDTAGNPEKWPPADTAREKLAALAVGHAVEISARSPQRDRYGRQLVHVYVRRQGQRLWLQDLLVGLGQARVNPEQLTAACATVLLTRESEARRARRGLWRNSAYDIRDASKERALMRHRSTFQLVEGTVRDVATVRSRTFVNFGRNWRTDFTAGINRRTATKAGINNSMLSAMKGRRVRIRGWIDRRGGPFVTIRSMKQIELVPSNKLAGKQNRQLQPVGPQKERRPNHQDSDAIDL